LLLHFLGADPPVPMRGDSQRLQSTRSPWPGRGATSTRSAHCGLVYVLRRVRRDPRGLRPKLGFSRENVMSAYGLQPLIMSS
jgi:hypothetical protein